MQIDAHVRPIDSAPVRATGTIVVPNGAAVDLDSGKIGARDMPSGDIAVLGAPSSVRSKRSAGRAGPAPA